MNKSEIDELIRRESKTWPRERILAELKKLDGITGLNGAELPIEYTMWNCTLGMFHVTKKREPQKFSFSKIYLDDPSLPDEINIDTIRHEYAHYMDLVLYGNIGHSRTWKKCCGDVGIAPNRVFSDFSVRYFKRLNRISSENEIIYKSYNEGMIVLHDKFGLGEIIRVMESSHDRILIIKFEDGTVRRLSALWVHEHCC